MISILLKKILKRIEFPYVLCYNKGVEVTYMKKALAVLLALDCVLSATVLTSCRKLSGNQLDFYYLPASFTLSDGVTDIQSGNGQVFHVDYTAKTISVTNDGEYGYPPPPIEGGTAPRYLLSIADEYKGVEDDLLKLHVEGNENSVIYTQGYLIDENIYGICNVYEDTVGYLSGGGNYGVEEISHAVYYRYDDSTDEFTVLSKIDGVAMLAFSGEQVIYWKNKKLFALDTRTNEEVFLCDDNSYDEGVQRQSRGSVYFNDEHVLFYFVKAKGAKEACYAYLYSFSAQKIIQLNCK